MLGLLLVDFLEGQIVALDTLETHFASSAALPLLQRPHLERKDLQGLMFQHGKKLLKRGAVTRYEALSNSTFFEVLQDFTGRGVLHRGADGFTLSDPGPAMLEELRLEAQARRQILHQLAVALREVHTSPELR